MRSVRSLAALAVTAAVLAGCGNDSPGEDDGQGDGDRADPPPTRVVVTTSNGEVVEFTDFSVTCRASEDDQPSAQIVMALSGYGDAEQPSRPDGPAMIIEAADSTGGTTVELPHNEGYGNEQTFINVFITEAGDERELASHTEQSTGEIEVVSASCEPTPKLEVRIDGVLDSELSDDGTVTVEGYVTAE